MLNILQKWLKFKFQSFLLWGYGWRSRIIQSNKQWLDPNTGVWINHSAACKSLIIQALFDYKQRSK